jgi:hypothetical protein
MDQTGRRQHYPENDDKFEVISRVGYSAFKNGIIHPKLILKPSYLTV